LAQHAADAFDELVTEYHNPDNDARVRALLVWAVGDAGIPSAVPFPADRLTDADAAVRDAATYALEQIRTKDARTVTTRALPGAAARLTVLAGQGARVGARD
jgi:HEAT repeat protein